MTTKNKRKPEISMEDGKVYLDKFEQHECCDCSLIHNVSYHVENGRIFTKWRRNQRATAKARKAANIEIKRK